MFLKQCVDPGTRLPDSEQASSEFHALTAVARALDASVEHDIRFHVPRALGLLDQQAIVVQQFVDGKSIAQAIGDADRPRQRALVEGAARWLQHFHAAKPHANGPLDADEKLATVQRQWHHTRDNDIRSALDTLTANSGRLTRASLVHSWLHADFKADNVLVTEEGFFGAEPHVGFVNAVSYDLASFLNTLMLTSREYKGRHYRADERHLEQVFVSAYWDGSTVADNTVESASLGWIRLYHMLSSWHTTRRGRKPIGWWVDRHFRPCVVELKHDLNRLATVSADGPTDGLR